MDVAALNAQDYIADLAKAANVAQNEMGMSSHDQRNQALILAAKAVRDATADILSANEKDIKAGQERGLTAAFIDRLALDEARIDAMAAGLEAIATLPDPLGAELASWQVPSGLQISRQSTALGVIGIIYESRPNVTVDAAGLCIKSGNAAILRGGSDSAHTSALLGEAMRKGLHEAGLPADTVQLVATTDRAAVGAMLTAVGLIDVIVPRGGRSLVERVQNEARVPVFAHLEGICHSYVATGAVLESAVDVVVNAKMRRTGICGATETLLIDEAIAAEFLPPIAEALSEKGCELRGCDKARALVDTIVEATEADWSTEYLDAILSVKIVPSIDAAIAHVKRYSSGHTESIITQDEAAIERFLNEIDSAIVMANASTQFADGGEFGMGAEIGIATGKMHARGPVGAAQLTSFKYVVIGDGHTRP